MEYLKEGENYFQDYHLEQFEWSVRTRNVLKNENINLLSELVSYNKYELLRIPNFGRRSLKEIEAFLSNLNLNLGMFLDEEDILSAYDENNRIVKFYENPTNETNTYSDNVQQTFQD